MSRLAQSVNQFIPAPIGGLNTRDPLPVMPETDAVEIVNLNPNTFGLELRPNVTGIRDYSLHGSSSTYLTKIMVLPKKDGTGRYVVEGGDGLYEITSAGQTNITAASSPNDFNTTWIVFKERLAFCDNDGTPSAVFVGETGNAARTTFTGPAGAHSDHFVALSAYKGRLYFIERESLSYWYAGLGAVSGAVTEIDLSSIFTNGGSLSILTAVNVGPSTGIDELFVAISSTGEGLAYSGSYPGSANWSLVAKFQIPDPAHINGFCRVGPDAVVLTERGVVSILKALSGATENELFLSDKINPTIQAAVKAALTSYTAPNPPGMGLLYLPVTNQLLVNIPTFTNYTAGSAGYADQYVYSFTLGAWTKWEAVHALCMAYDSTGIHQRVLFGSDNERVGVLDLSVTGTGIDTDLDNVAGAGTAAVNEQYFIGAFQRLNSRHTKHVKAIESSMGRTGQYKATVKVYENYDPATVVSSNALTKAKTGANTYEYYRILHDLGTVEHTIAVGMDVKDSAGANSARIFGNDLLFEPGGYI